RFREDDLGGLVTNLAESVVYSKSRRERRARSASDPSIMESRDRCRKLAWPNGRTPRESSSADFLPRWIQESSRRDVSKPARETHARWAHRAVASAACCGALLTPSGRAFADPSSLPPDYGYNYGEIETA